MKSAAVCARLVTDDATGASFRWVSAETCKNRIDGDIPGLVVAVVYSLSFRLRRGGWLFFFLSHARALLNLLHLAAFD